MQQLSGKRLLVLGGNPWVSAIKQFVDEHKITLIAAGNNPNSDLFKYAEESYIIDSTDPDAMKKLITERCIDGVYMGGTEPVIAVACEYINDLGLPCYCNRYQWDALQDKAHFKSLCIKHGLPVVPQYEIFGENYDAQIDGYPVITKPADGSGSNGFSVCYNQEELIRGYKKALKYSPTNRVVVEKFVKNSGVVCFYTISNGKAVFSGLSDKYPVKFEEQGSFVGGLFVYESKFENEFRIRFENKIQFLVDDLGIKEGPLWIEVFRNGDDFFFNEVGFRYGGSISVYTIDYLMGINQVAADIYYALTGESEIYGHSSMICSSVPKKNYYATYPIFVKEGTIGNVVGIEQLRQKNEVVTVIEKMSIGCVVENTGSWGQTFALIHFVFDDETELLEELKYIQENISVQDDNGEELIVKMLNLSEFKTY